MGSGHTIERLYALLGVEPGVSPDELKRAFRRKAKEMHPDRSNAPDAHEKFLELNEAYDFLSKLLSTEDIHSRSTENIEDLYKTWEQKERQKVRKSVKDHLKKKYSGTIRYINDPIYEALETVFVHFNFILAVFSVLILPILLISSFGSTGIMMSVFANVFLLLFTMSAVRNRHLLNVKTFIKSLDLLIRTKPVKTGVLITFNATIFLTIGMNTLISLTHLFLAYTCCSLIAIVIILFRKSKSKEKVTSYDLYFWGLSVSPAFISILLTVNFLFSSTPEIETYHYTAHTRNSYVEGGMSHKRKSGLIELENGTYSSYAGIRLFINGIDLSDEGSITYMIEKGGLGYRVLKGYKLGPKKKL